MATNEPKPECAHPSTWQLERTCMYYHMDHPQRRYWRERKAAQPLIDATHTASILAARLPRDAYVRMMLRTLVMHDAPPALIILWFDHNCTDDFPCY